MKSARLPSFKCEGRPPLEEECSLTQHKGAQRKQFWRSRSPDKASQCHQMQRVEVLERETAEQAGVRRIRQVNWMPHAAFASKTVNSVIHTSVSLIPPQDEEVFRATCCNCQNSFQVLMTESWVISQVSIKECVPQLSR